ncbi:hypothetical protein [Paenibacillus antarcticus]|uniref:hypothetical protein n=1 Tax=Paenibacillus antarcticus TaxID=253703 RepID=UPI000AB2B849|nr:hypothetical protein [Paenibacillus antarcticus]
MAKSIVEKLSLQKYVQVAVLDQPEGTNYLSELTGYDITLKEHSYDLIFAFVLDMYSLKELVDRVIEHEHLNKDGYLFVAYPKKGNKVYSTFIHRDDLFAGIGSDSEGYIGTSDIKFTRMVGLDDVFTVVGLKEDARSKGKVSSQSSQRVDDYITLIPNIEKDLEDTPDLLTLYHALTQGYRKDQS